jgi:hypothetical protein
MPDALVVALFTFAAFCAGLLWIRRYWAIRTWRTLAVFVVGGSLAGVAITREPYGLFIAVPILGLTLFLVWSVELPLMSMSQLEYDYAERLRQADRQARRIYTDRATGNASDQSIAALERIIDGLSGPAPHAAWEPVRAAKTDELKLARALLVSGVADTEALEELRACRAKSGKLFLAARRARSSFWGA